MCDKMSGKYRTIICNKCLCFQVLSMSEELRRALYASSAASLDLELCVPDLNGVTEILSEDHRKQLCRHLPARAEGRLQTKLTLSAVNDQLYC